MRIENIASLSGANLLNIPTISKVINIITNTNQIVGGELFVAFNNEDIKIAIEKGVFGILCNKCNISDNDIAWLESENIKNSLLRLVRFELINKKVIMLDYITYKITKQLLTNDDYYFLDLEDLYNFNYLSIKKADFIIIKECQDIQNLGIELEAFEDIQDFAIKDRGFLAFELYLHESVYTIELPPLFKTNFIKALSLINTNNINYSLSKASTFDFYQIEFVSKHLKPTGFGKSEMVLIYADSEILETLYNFLKKEAGHLNIVLAKNIELLHDTAFNIAILDKSKKYKAKKKSEKNLFDMEKIWNH
jgi:hypothetical protein